MPASIASWQSSDGLAPSSACSPSRGHRRLLGGAQLQLGLGVLAVADVREHAVPAREPSPAITSWASSRIQTTRPSRWHRRYSAALVSSCSSAGGLTLLGDHPRRRRRGAAARPTAAVACTIPRREPEDRLDLGADVVPAAVGAGVGDVQNRGNLREQSRIIGARRVGSGRRAGSDATAGSALNRHVCARHRPDDRERHPGKLPARSVVSTDPPGRTVRRQTG